ncbi:hypothetical protein BH11PAT3_BH11PAT3_0920 [soil metagenome]
MSHTKTFFMIYIIVTVVLVLLFGYFIFIIRSKGQEASVLMNEADSATEQEGLTQSIQAVKNASKNDIILLNQYALTEDTLVPLIELLEKTGKSMKLSTKTTSVSLAKQDSGEASISDQVTIELETDGAWNSSIGFIHLLENLPTGVFISSSSLTAGNGAEAAGSPATSSQIVVAPKRIWHTKTVLLLSSFK